MAITIIILGTIALAIKKRPKNAPAVAENEIYRDGDYDYIEDFNVAVNECYAESNTHTSEPDNASTGANAHASHSEQENAITGANAQASEPADESTEDYYVT